MERAAVRSGTIAFLLGVLALHAHAALPDPALAQALPLLAALAVVRPAWRPALLAGCGFTLALAHAHAALHATLPAAIEGADLVVEGRVAGLPHRDGRALRFELVVETPPPGVRRVPRRLRLRWYGDAPDLVPGDRWRLTVRLKRPRGLANPGGFDYERWAVAARVGAGGYVRDRPAPERLGRRAADLDRVRARLAAAIERALDGHPRTALVTALAVGAREGIDGDAWRVLRDSGTAHLMAISGLHVGLVAGAAFAVARAAWARIPGAAARVAGARAAAVAALLAAAGYAALAGFALPTVRALVMVGAFMTALWLRRHAAPGASLALAALAVLVLDPLAPLSGGFWLSFGAVAAILLGAGARHPPADEAGRLRRAWRGWGRVQWVVALGLAPIALAAFGRIPAAAPIANLVAVPWTGAVAVPGILAGALLLPVWEAGGAALLHVGAWALDVLWPLLAAFAEHGWMIPAARAPTPWMLGAGAIGAALLLAPRGVPARWLGLAWLAPLVLAVPERPAPGAFRLVVLDVGHGLAAVVETRRHVLVYDAGPRYSARLDAGRTVVVPYLRARGLRAVDRLVISHGDNDHAGGAGAVVDAVPVRSILAGAGVAAPPGARPCAIPAEWRWDGVRFRVLHPARRGGLAGNDASCVVRITAAGGAAALLPGDVERAGERRLLARARAHLAAGVVVAPHHGSRTSSTSAFLAATRPRIAVFSAAPRSRFPDPGVVARYAARGAAGHTTGRDGAITIAVPAAGPPRVIERYRRDHPRWWRAR